MLTDCSIQTHEADETLDFDFCSTNVVNKLIMSAECLREAFSELDMTSDVLEIVLSPDPPHCRLTTFGYAGTTQVRHLSAALGISRGGFSLFLYRLTILKTQT